MTFHCTNEPCYTKQPDYSQHFLSPVDKRCCYILALTVDDTALAVESTLPIAILNFLRMVMYNFVKQRSGVQPVAFLSKTIIMLIYKNAKQYQSYWTPLGRT